MAGAVRWWVLLLSVLAGGAWGEALPDPTRPPPGFGADAGAGVEETPALRLQSVVLPQSGRPMAVIGGQVVHLGDKVGDGRLVRLTETEAVISGPQGITRLPLTPEAVKTPVREKGAGKVPARKKEKP